MTVCVSALDLHVGRFLRRHAAAMAEAPCLFGNFEFDDDSARGPVSGLHFHAQLG